ncbi:hypothetical protein AB0B25_06235 [Nocardia sp. NPDC049190]|uniref:hypothetical protein n=1 Tax=Nocardia sp. NPDC049190 TaxID=3155650 RepID=UPI0033D1EE06
MSVRTATAPTRLSASLIDSVKGFVADHGKSATAVLQPLGRVGVRVTLVGADGILGDRVVADLDTAEELVAVVDGLTEADEWDRELVSIVTPRQGHWAKMAGWVARQTRFPTARNENSSRA